MRTLLALSTLVTLSPAPSRDGTDAALAHRLTRWSPRGDAAVTIRTFQFAPDTLRGRAGTRVVWTNADEIEHTITSGTPDEKDGPFHGVVGKRGATYSADIEQSGTYRYFCDRHPFMTGTIIISR